MLPLREKREIRQRGKVTGRDREEESDSGKGGGRENEGVRKRYLCM